MSVNPLHPHKTFRLEPNWKICLFAALLLPVLIALGFWQLERAGQKQTIQHALEVRQALPPLDWTEYPGRTQSEDALEYRWVTVQGQFSANKTWLIENKTWQGRIGFHVVTAFILPDGDSLLVNRGWIPGTGYRDRLPVFVTPQGRMTMTGQLSLPSENRMLADAAAGSGDWPRLALAVDTARMAAEAGRTFWPHVLYPREDAEGSFVRDFNPAVMSSDTHRGYAVQWFGLAVALVILTLFANSNLASVIRERFRKSA